MWVTVRSFLLRGRSSRCAQQPPGDLPLDVRFVEVGALPSNGGVQHQARGAISLADHCDPLGWCLAAIHLGHGFVENLDLSGVEPKLAHAAYDKRPAMCGEAVRGRSP